MNGLKLLLTVTVLTGLLVLLPDDARADSIVAQGYSVECYDVDSVNASCFLTRYQPAYREDTGRAAAVTTFARGGQKVSTLRWYLENYRNYYRVYHRDAEVLFLDMGAGDFLSDVRGAIRTGNCNDLCVNGKLEAFKRDYDASFNIMHADKGAQTKMIAISMYQFYVEEDLQLDSDLDGESNFEEGRKFYQGVNAHIKAKAAMHNVQVLNLYEAFNGPTGRETTPAQLGYVSLDKVHPDPDGATEIARKARALGYAP